MATSATGCPEPTYVVNVTDGSSSSKWPEGSSALPDLKDSVNAALP